MSQKLSTVLFGEIQGSYDSFDELEKKVVAVCNTHLRELPAGYSYRDLIDWGRKSGRIVLEGGRLKVEA
jgi:hypothetical protein